MPGVAAPVEGVANVRGALVTVVSAAALLGEPTERTGSPPWLVVLQYRGGRVGLGVDDVEDLVVRDDDAALLEIEPRLEAVFGAAGTGGAARRALEGGT
jgi:chemotaxis signal transduction protein